MLIAEMKSMKGIYHVPLMLLKKGLGMMSGREQQLEKSFSADTRELWRVQWGMKSSVREIKINA